MVLPIYPTVVYRVSELNIEVTLSSSETNSISNKYVNG